jgi:hypothetical protein
MLVVAGCLADWRPRNQPQTNRCPAHYQTTVGFEHRRATATRLGLWLVHYPPSSPSRVAPSVLSAVIPPHAPGRTCYI